MAGAQPVEWVNKRAACFPLPTTLQLPPIPVKTLTRYTPVLKHMMVLFVLLCLFWYSIVTQAQVLDVSGSGCAWGAGVYTPGVPSALSDPVELVAYVAYDGIGCTSTVTGEFTFIFGQVGYSASQVTLIMQPTATTAIEYITLNYPQLPASTLGVLEGTSSDYILVYSLEMNVMCQTGAITVSVPGPEIWQGFTYLET
jgi:hypothetical protein